MEKIIHQTWKEVINNEWTDSVKSVFKDYEYKFWTDADNDKLIEYKYPQFRAIFETLTPVEKSDFCRYLYIYECGGIYLDVDVKMNRFLPLENADVYLCDQTEEANTVKSPMIIDPFFLAGNKGCQFFYSLCNSISKGTIYRLLSQNTNTLYSLKTLYKTGPIMLTKFYLLNKYKYNIKVLKNVFTTKKFVSNIPKESYYGIHIQMNTWLKKEDRRD